MRFNKLFGLEKEQCFLFTQNCTAKDLEIKKSEKYMKRGLCCSLYSLFVEKSSKLAYLVATLSQSILFFKWVSDTINFQELFLYVSIEVQ